MTTRTSGLPSSTASKQCGGGRRRCAKATAEPLACTDPTALRRACVSCLPTLVAVREKATLISVRSTHVDPSVSYVLQVYRHFSLVPILLLESSWEKQWRTDCPERCSPTFRPHCIVTVRTCHGQCPCCIPWENTCFASVHVRNMFIGEMLVNLERQVQTRRAVAGRQAGADPTYVHELPGGKYAGKSL